MPSITAGQVQRPPGWFVSQRVDQFGRFIHLPMVL
jgi:hypothetical protein